MRHILVGCEGSPLFDAWLNDDAKDPWTDWYMDLDTVHEYVEWFNSILEPDQDLAYYQDEAGCFCFPTEDGEWEEIHATDEFYLADTSLGLKPIPVCTTCKQYFPCDCEGDVLTDSEALTRLELEAVLGIPPDYNIYRRLIHTIRELDAQLRTEQGDHA